MSIFIRKTKTASGATAVQIVTKDGSDIVAIDHIGSAHNDEELADLYAIANARLHEGQLSLDLFEETPKPSLLMLGSYSKLLWDVLSEIYRHLGFDDVDDDVFRDLVLARIIEPTSKLDTIRVIEELGLEPPTNSSIHRTLRRSIDENYRGTLERCCFNAASPTSLSLLLYDVTTLYFEVQKEDDYRKSGMSKERRLEPQITVGLLVGRDGFPLQVRSFEGNRAEVKTFCEALFAFRDAHPDIEDITVTADAAMLSSANLSVVEDMGYHYIVGSRLSKCPYEIVEYQKKPGQELQDGQIFDTVIEMNTGRGTKRVKRRVVYQYRARRASLDLRNIDKALEKAERMASGSTPYKRNRFLTVKGGKREVNYKLVEENRLKAGIKGYVTDLDVPAQEVIEAYHQLFQVEKSFRMSKSDLKARPIFHHKRDSIEAHLTIVFAALAIARRIEAATGISIKKFVQKMRLLRTGKVSINGKICEVPPDIPIEAADILRKLEK